MAKTIDSENDQSKIGIMPINRKAWYEKLSASNFSNTWCQYEDIQMLDSVDSILEIGPGQGFSTEVLRWKNYEVSTFDIDETFNPDFVGSVHNLKRFHDQQFDLVIASHVLEHIPVSLLEQALAEIARVSKYTLIYLPVAGTHHIQLRFLPGLRRLDFSIYLDIFKFYEAPSGEDPIYCNGQHYWEVGYRGFRVRNLIDKFSSHFDIVKHYRNKNWNASYNFVLKSLLS